MQEKIISVAVLCFPNGDTYHVENKSDYARKHIKEWRDKHKEYDNTMVSMSVSYIQMFEKDFKKIPACVIS